MDERQHAKDQLAALVEDFRQATARGDLQGQSEATARTWVERLLGIFGWDPADPRQVRCYGWSEGFRVSHAFDFDARQSSTAERVPMGTPTSLDFCTSITITTSTSSTCSGSISLAMR